MKYDKTKHFLKEKNKISKSGRMEQVGKYYCIINGEWYNSIRGLTNFLRTTEYTSQTYYDFFYKEELEGKCEICSKHTSFSNIIDGYKKFCSSCFQKTEKHIEAISNRFKCENGKEKLKISISKRKETNSLKSENEKCEIYNRIVETKYSKYGKDHFSTKTKKQWENYSEEDVFNIVSKSNRTKKEKGTIEYNPFRKSNKKIILKDFEYSCQGYEDCVLKFLINDFGFEPKQVLINQYVPKIKYSGNKSGIYKPDIFLPELNLILEIKSDYTLAIDLDRIIEKQKQTISQGYIHLIFSIRKIDKNREMIDKDKKMFCEFLNMAISSQAQLFEKVQRLSLTREYGAITIGTGSARIPKDLVINPVYDIV